MSSKNNKYMTKTKNVSFRLPLDEVQKLESIALLKNKSLSEYLRNIVQQNIKQMTEQSDEDQTLVPEIAIALATLLQLCGQQAPAVRDEIQLKAEPILEKLSKIFKVMEGA